MKNRKDLLFLATITFFFFIPICAMFLCSGMLYHDNKIINVLFYILGIIALIYSVIKCVQRKTKKKYIYGVFVWLLVGSIMILGISSFKYNVYPYLTVTKQNYTFEKNYDKSLKKVFFPVTNSFTIIYERNLWLGFKYGIRVTDFFHENKKYDLRDLHEKIEKQKGIGFCKC